MSTHFTLAEEASVVEALAPAADAAGRNGAWVTLKNAYKAAIKVHIAQGNAATVELIVQQAQDVSGTGAKAIAENAKIWACLATDTSDALVAQPDGVTFTTDAALKNKIVVIQIDPATLDVANGFDCIRVQTGASNAANITEATYILTPLRYAGSPPPSAIAN